MNFDPHRLRAEAPDLMPQGHYVLPRFEERTSQGWKQYDPYSKLYEERIVFLGVPIDDGVANDVMAQLLCLESMDPDRDISLYINSPGGSFSATSAIYDTMQFVNPDVQTVCLGMAASGAAVLLAGGTKGKRMALPNAKVMIHQPALSGSMYGQASDMEIQAQEMLRVRRQLEQMLADDTKKDVDEVSKDIERDKYLTAKEALEYGLIDVITEPRKVASGVAS
ncbi:ATP-dependent Clp protease proteolytic subunit [Mangrovactinospora gilvigrisea]|uniref:ATP-dependent Clp protease proteolytic subunit n=1 Tax=Mangrovactinospora gilvigrisea TaxID=1428644 RepID=A0A1J7BGC3_9ACTN|nr:ATP-dependent Clp protease proteolytic subunit [Mangrovactinospora gilvigrisea]OIV37727.1 ATP-dependent Clp protease proteolytic subunit [Mangrovactinospora gilvigrisea]